MLKTQASVLLEPDENPFEITESDVEDANEVIDSDEDGDILTLNEAAEH